MEDERFALRPPFCISTFNFAVLHASVFFARGVAAFLVAALRVPVVALSFFVLRDVLVFGEAVPEMISETAEAASVITSPTPDTISRMGEAALPSEDPAAAAAARCGSFAVGGLSSASQR